MAEQLLFSHKHRFPVDSHTDQRRVNQVQVINHNQQRALFGDIFLALYLQVGTQIKSQSHKESGDIIKPAYSQSLTMPPAMNNYSLKLKLGQTKGERKEKGRKLLRKTIFPSTLTKGRGKLFGCQLVLIGT
jgi:hypothetical protein